MSDRQHVYLIATESDVIKIGISNDPASRLDALQIGHHEQLRLDRAAAG